LARSHCRLGQPTQATALARKLQDLLPTRPEVLLEVAQDFALAIPLVGKAKAELTAAESAERHQYAVQAVAALRAAIRHGFKDLKTLRTDPDLASLQPFDEFKRLLSDLERKPAGKTN
jgi:hypothetical protein